jgi:hypothetical protein
MVEKRGGKYVVLTEDGMVVGKYDNAREAMRRDQQIEFFRSRAVGAGGIKGRGRPRPGLDRGGSKSGL